MDSLEEPGGQVTAMYPEKEIFDIAGYPRVLGSELVNALLTQAQSANPAWFLNQRALHAICGGTGTSSAPLAAACAGSR